MAFKWSDGDAEDFPRLSVKVRDEIVAFGAPGELKVDEDGVIGGGVHLKPEEVNELVEKHGDDVVFFDGRNAMEAEIGKFKNAVVPDVKTTHDFIKEIESGKYDWMKDRPIVSYCTGGIRCEILSVLMKTAASKTSTKSTAVSCATAKSTATRACGKAPCTSLTSACTTNSALVSTTQDSFNWATACNAVPVPIPSSTALTKIPAASRCCCVTTALRTPRLPIAAVRTANK